MMALNLIVVLLLWHGFSALALGQALQKVVARLKNVRPEDFYDDSILRGLERDALVQQLYR